MPTIAELAKQYRTMHRKQTELDRRITDLPLHDIEGKDVLMDELEVVVASLHETVGQLAQTRAADTVGLQTKAAIIVGNCEDELSALCKSLAYDVVDVLAIKS